VIKLTSEKKGKTCGKVHQKKRKKRNQKSFGLLKRKERENENRPSKPNTINGFLFGFFVKNRRKKRNNNYNNNKSGKQSIKNISPPFSCCALMDITETEDPGEGVLVR
jgi:hypothetical protein